MANEPINPQNFESEAFGDPQIHPEGRPQAGGLQGLIEYGVQAETYKRMLAGPNGSLRSRIWGAGQIHDRALASAIQEKVLDNPSVRKGLSDQQAQRLELFRKLARKEEKGAGFNPLEAAQNAWQGQLTESNALTNLERQDLGVMGRHARGFVESQSPELRQSIMEEARHRQGSWRAGRVVNKGMNMAFMGSLGYDLGPTAGGALGIGVMGLGVAHGVGSFFNGYADARGHAGGFLGWQVNKASALFDRHSNNPLNGAAPLHSAEAEARRAAFNEATAEASSSPIMRFLRRAGNRVSNALNPRSHDVGNPLIDETTHGSVEAAARRVATEKALASEIKHAGFEGVTRGEAIAAGVRKATGRNHALGLSPRNMLLYGATIGLGALANWGTRAPVGGRLQTRFAGSEQTMAMMNDPQNVEARMQALSHLQSDTFSGAQAMGREARYFVRQWTAPSDMYGLR